MYLELNILRY